MIHVSMFQQVIDQSYSIDAMDVIGTIDSEDEINVQDETDSEEDIKKNKDMQGVLDGGVFSEEFVFNEEAKDGVFEWGVDEAKKKKKIKMVDGQVDLCRVCSGNVEDSDQAIYYDLCHHWVHVVCDPMITISEYGHMIDCPTEEPWLCHMCRAENSDDNSDDNSDIQCRSGGLSCLCLNIRSVVSKRNEFLAYVLAHDPDLVAVTETFLDDSVHDSHIIPPGYVLFRKDRNRHGGGVMLLVRGSINVSRCVNYETSCELLWVKLSLKPMSVIFGVFYRPPYHSTHDLQALQDSLLSVSDKHSCIIVCGDFNVPNIDWATAAPTLTSPNASLLCNIVMDSFLTQMVTLPTRENNILDLVLTSHADLVTYVHLTDNLADCDHEVVEFLVAVTSPAIHERKRKLYNFKQANFEEFESLLSATPWDIIDYNGDVDMAWNLWKDLFLSAADQVIPKITWRKRKSKCWFSSNTITMIHRKRKLYRVKKKHPSPENLARYRRISNIVRLLTRQETKCHFASLCDTYRHNPKQFWKWVNSVRNFVMSFHLLLVALELSQMIKKRQMSLTVILNLSLLMRMSPILTP